MPAVTFDGAIVEPTGHEDRLRCRVVETIGYGYEVYSTQNG